MWTGFLTVAFSGDPSPNDQFQDVGELVEVSVNVTVNGAVSVNGVPVKFATGDPGFERRTCAITFFRIVVVLSP